MVQTRIVPSHPALIVEGKSRFLVVTDLHIGFESNLAANDIFVGKNTTVNETISELESLIDDTNADSLILLGDVKSSIKSISKNEWDEIPLFFNKIKEKCDYQRTEQSYSPIDEDAQAGLEFLLRMLCNVPYPNQIPADGARHNVVIEPAQKIQPDRRPETDEYPLSPQQEPPPQPHNELAGAEYGENTCKDPQVHPRKCALEVSPYLFTEDPDCRKYETADDHRDADRQQYAPSSVSLPVSH